MKDQTAITLAGLLCLTVIISIAIAKGYDDFLTATAVFVIAAAMGIVLPRPKWIKGS